MRPPAQARTQPYPFLWNLVALFGGLVDPLVGVLGKILGIFWQPEPPPSADSPRRRRRGLTMILGGIEGPSIYNYSMVMGMLRSRYRGAVVRFPWNAGMWGLRSLVNLIGRRHHERQSDLLAQTIMEHARRFPDSPICLLAQSGGCWIVVRALEKLPEDVRVHAAVLLAPSMSPAYDIRKAASKCRAGLTSIGALGDFFFLGIGTLVFGTSDRVFTPAAGWVGWHHHPPGFIEARWHPSWAKHSYIGNHTSSSAVGFIQRVVAALLAPAGRD